MTVTDINNGSKICEFLAATDVANGSLFGARLNPKIAIQLYIERKALEFRYNYEGIATGNLPSTDLINVANYVYKLWANWSFIALNLIVGGGIIPPVNPPSGGGSGIGAIPLWIITVGNPGITNPVVGTDYFQDNRLIGLGDALGQFTFTLNGGEMINTGVNKNMDFNSTTGTVYITPLVWNALDVLIIDLNQKQITA